MALTINPSNINIDTIRNLDIDKQYYLSKSGQIKEASGWMKFKCMIGCSGARQKVANLIDTVRVTLLNNAAKTQDATLDTNIGTIRRDRMVSGEDLYNLATRFAEANPQKIAKNTAEKMIATNAKQWAQVMVTKHGSVAKDPAALEKIIQHVLKRMFNNQLPMKKADDSMMKLDSDVFKDRLLMTIPSVNDEIASLLDKIDLGGRPMDKHFAQHIIDTLYNEDGTRNNKTVADLKSPITVKTDYAFKRNMGNIPFSRAQAVCRQLVDKRGVNPEKKLQQILDLCGDDHELKDYVLEVAPDLAVNSNNEERSEKAIKAKLAAIKDSLEEIKEVQTQFPNSATMLKNAMANLGAGAMPKGLIREIAAFVHNAKIDSFRTLDSFSPAFRIYRAFNDLRQTISQFGKKIDISDRFTKAGEKEVGAPHTIASQNILMALILTKAGPGLMARLPNIIKGSEFGKMTTIVNTLIKDIGKEAYMPLKHASTASAVLQEQNRVADMVIANMETFIGEDIKPNPPPEDQVDFANDVSAKDIMAVADESQL